MNKTIPFFPQCVCHIYMYRLIEFARMFSVMLKRKSEWGHPYIVPELSGKILSFFPLNMMLASGFIDYSLSS